ncbi:LysM peptidoglycan-binding domain-containing protein [Aquibium oceanicum]|uniref:LysM peptidoglycan-binding domain-containing protein n=1 Tax=Aquibium oceanicum TaxID=1670800 RepID=UPI00361B16B4
MVISPWKALLFIAGGTAAAAVAGYAIGAFDGVFAPAPPMVAALPEKTAPAVGESAPAATDVPLPGTEKPAEGSNPVADAKVSPPTFDVLRVEKDGSVVIAGKSAPQASVEIINGTAVIAQTVSTGDGDFAVVLDEPLKPGDYQIVLRATTPANVAATSVETALVSVPDSPEGEVLALVEEPGKPSKLITVPEGGDVLADLPEGDIAPAGSTDTASQESNVAVAEPSSGSASDAVTGAGTNGESSVTTDVAGSQAPAGGDVASQPASQDVATLPAGGQDAAATAREDVAILDENAAAPTDGGSAQPAPAAASSSEPGAAAAEQTMASADGTTDQPSASAAQDAAASAAGAPDNAPAAGTADPARTVAENAPPVAGSPAEASDGQATAAKPATASEGREEQVALATPSEPAIDRAAQSAPRATAPAPSANQPTVRVEAVEIEGRKVFVAGQASPGMVVRVYANEYLLGETVASEGGRFLIETERDLPVGDYIIRADLLDDGGRKVVARAAVPFQREEGEAIAAVAPAAPVADAAERPLPPPLPSNAPADAPEQTAGQPSAPVASAPASETPAPAVAEAAPPAATTKPAATEDLAAANSAEKPPVAQDAEPAPAQRTASADSGSTPGTAASHEITAPKLQSVQGAVIIRRGDTLWRISRRVYGRGVRYSTIYVANRDQIADPHRIWPGQVFRVPEKSTEGEAADLEAMGEQMTTVE